MKSDTKRTVATVLLMIVLECGFATAQKVEKKLYRNERWGFCLTYPSTWGAQEGFNWALALVREVLAASVSGGRESGDGQIRVLQQLDGTYQRYRSLLSTVTYVDALRKRPTMEEVLRIKLPDNVIFSVEVRGRPTAVRAFRPTLRKMLASDLKLECPAAGSQASK